ncbi:MAG: PAS domain S-box protein [Bacteroidota bacterium]
MAELLKYIDFVFAGISVGVIFFLLGRRLLKRRTNSASVESDRGGFANWINQWGGFVAAVLVLVAGLFVSWDVSRQQEVYMRQTLRHFTNDLSRSFHPEHVEHLQFSANDSNSIYFQRLNKQIGQYSDYSGVNSIYTLGKKDGSYYFGPEGIDPEDSRYSPPGTKYMQPPDLLDEIFSNRVTRVVGPFEDEYGRFVSCFSPVVSTEGEDVLMVVGVDIPVDEWKWELYSVKLKPLAVTLILLILIYLGFRLPDKRENVVLLGFRTFRYWEGLLVFVGGLILTFYIGNMIRTDDLRYRKAVFSNAASVERAAVTKSLEMVRHHIRGMSKLFTASEEVTRSEFRDYVSEIIDYPFITSAGWIEQKSDSNFNVKYLLEAEKCPFDTGAFHFRGDSLRHQPVMETISTGLIAATNIYPCKAGNMIDLFLLTRDSAGRSTGLVYFSLRPLALIEDYLVDRAGDNNHFNLEFNQINDVDSDSKNRTSTLFSLNQKNDQELFHQYLDFYFGKVFSIHVTAGPAFNDLYRRKDYVTIIGVGFLLSLIVSGFILVMSNRRYLLQKQVDKHVSRLKASEERFRSLFSNMLEGVAFHETIFDEKGTFVNYRIEEVNRAFEKILGLKRNQVIGQPADWIYDGDIPFLEKYRKVVDSGYPLIFESYYPSLETYFQISVAPWGKAGFATIFSDITERRMAEERLKKSEEKYRLISENAGDLIWLYDPEKDKFTYISPSVAKMSGFPDEEVVGKGYHRILTAESNEEIHEQMSLRIARFEMGDYDALTGTLRVDMQTKEEHVVPLEIITTLLPGEYGKISGILGVGRDISDRLEAEEALRHSEEKFRLLVENMSDLVVKVDAEGYFNYVSPSYCRLFGKSEEALLHEKFLPLVHPEDRKETDEAMQKLVRPPHHVTLEQRAMTRDGWRWLSWNDSAILDEDGNIKEIIGVGRDITERKNAEKALEESRKMLEHQNKEYSALNEEYLTMNEELTSINEDLSTAIERAEESERLKTAFLQNMSHEIRTPLNAIIGFSEMLGMNFLTDEDRKEYTSIIVNSSRQLLELVNDILTISAIESRQHEITISEVNINALFSELYTIFSSKAKSKDVGLKVNKALPDKDAVLRTDELKLRQIMVNLIGNALKFTAEGFVEFGYRPEDDQRIVFYVKDTGVGISKEMQEHVFERFTQADGSVKGIYGGTGLGLAICKGHVEILGGRIWIDSTPGVGSVFYFQLPRQYF